MAQARRELGARFGFARRVSVCPETGDVVVVFAEVDAAEACVKALHGNRDARSGAQLCADFLRDDAAADASDVEVDVFFARAAFPQPRRARACLFPLSWTHDSRKRERDACALPRGKDARDPRGKDARDVPRRLKPRAVAIGGAFDAALGAADESIARAADEISVECSTFGPVLRALCDPCNAEVVVAFASSLSASECSLAMHGRFFDERAPPASLS